MVLYRLDSFGTWNKTEKADMDCQKDCEWIFTDHISTAKSHLWVGQKEPQF